MCHYCSGVLCEFGRRSSSWGSNVFFTWENSTDTKAGFPLWLTIILNKAWKEVLLHYGSLHYSHSTPLTANFHSHWQVNEYIFTQLVLFKASFINRCVTLTSAFSVAWLFFPPTASPFSSLHFGPSSVLCYPSSALILLPTGTSGSIFGWWAAEGLKHRVSQMCVVDMFAQIDCDVLHPVIISVLFSCIFFPVCTAAAAAAALLRFFLSPSKAFFSSLWRLYIDQCVFDKPVVWLCACVYKCVQCTVCVLLVGFFLGCKCQRRRNDKFFKRQRARRWRMEKCLFLFLKIVNRVSLRQNLWDKRDHRVPPLQPFKNLDRSDLLTQSLVVFYYVRKYGNPRKSAE